MKSRPTSPSRPARRTAAPAALALVAAFGAGCADFGACSPSDPAQTLGSMRKSAPRVSLSSPGGSSASVAPSLGGRVLSFLPAGAPENLFWNGPEDSRLGAWRNHGGEKTWIGPQGLWPSVNGGPSWPPPLFFDRDPFSADPAAPAEARTVTMRSEQPGAFACPFSVERRVSLDGATLAVEARLLPRADGKEAKARRGLKALPKTDEDWHVWSVAQVRYGRRAAIRSGAPWRFDGPGDDGSPIRQISSDGTFRVFEIDGGETKGKIFFDGDAIAVEYPEGSLVARRVPGEDDLPGPRFPLHAPAQLFSGYDGDPVSQRYLELEFTAVGLRTLRVEFSYFPGLGCLDALRRL